MMETQRAIDIIFNMMPEDDEEAEALSLAVSALRERLLAEQHNEQKLLRISFYPHSRARRCFSSNSCAVSESCAFFACVRYSSASFHSDSG